MQTDFIFVMFVVLFFAGGGSVRSETPEFTGGVAESLSYLRLGSVGHLDERREILVRVPLAKKNIINAYL